MFFSAINLFLKLKTLFEILKIFPNFKPLAFALSEIINYIDIGEFFFLEK